MAGQVDPQESTGRIPESELRVRLRASSVTILGCGGLGSNVAAMLLRSGVRKLTLVDIDRVEADNMNRQLFFREQIGMPKVEALAETLLRIDPDARLTLIGDLIDVDGLPRMVAGADVIVEAVDGVDTKTLIVDVCTRDFPDTALVSASGLAGYDSANRIETVRVADALWVVGDFESDVREGHALLASRVMVAAAHQAHAVIRILLGLDGE
ncbi:MAG: sulfur carrier protein ThiS adenylyltransferase ThiF [Coriobacteriia bacterium]|nr:sulfur carrier protein ThiS adenylyltransferase ThiF [Coriobacteriia bacterium]